MLAEAALLTLFVLAGNTLLHPVAALINRAPLADSVAEATYEVRLLVQADAMADLRDTLVQRLEAAKYPVGDVDVVDRDNDVVELVATLVSTSVAKKELDAVTRGLSLLPDVRHASWEGSTTD